MNTEQRTVIQVARLARPNDRAELARWVTLFTGLSLSDGPVCEGHHTPLDYLAHTFFEEGGDAVVWAGRGGGKTMLGAVATLLDLVFKPGIQIRILGGSFEQSEKMYAYLRRLFEAGFADLLTGPPTRRRLVLTSGSAVEVLAQSDRAVRGQRVQKVRCDEVELFDPAVWQAVQLTTRSLSAEENGTAVKGTIEALSTMHRPGGLMQQLLAPAEAGGRRMFAWCIWDVIAECHAERRCETCPLWNDCGGRAKRATGFVPVEDVIAMHGRVSRATWEHEMLCHRPRLENAVFPTFSRAAHVCAFPLGRMPEKGETLCAAGRVLRCEAMIAGVDFGYAAAFVCLWVLMLRDDAGQRVAWVVDELVTRQRTLKQNGQEMRERAAVGGGAMPWRPHIVYCDVAGRGANGQTGRTDESVLREAGFTVKSGAMTIYESLALVNDRVDPAEGGSRLLIDPRCVRLIAAFEGYQWKHAGEPLKDGVHDHPIDALRYALFNHDRPRAKVEIVNY